MEFREKIEQALSQIDDNVYYGKVPQKDLEEKNWNYLVFGKSTLSPSGNSNINLTDIYWVGIVRENYIPDELTTDIIDSLNSIPGLKLTQQEGNYEYLFKKNTDLVVEVLTLSFSKVRKCGNLCQ